MGGWGGATFGVSCHGAAVIHTCRLARAGVRSPTEPACRVVFENEQDSSSMTKRKRSLVTAEPQHVTLIVFGIGMVNRTHLEADIGGLTMESELKRIHGSFTLKEKMKGTCSAPAAATPLLEDRPAPGPETWPGHFLSPVLPVFKKFQVFCTECSF